MFDNVLHVDQLNEARSKGSTENPLYSEAAPEAEPESAPQSRRSSTAILLPPEPLVKKNGNCEN